MPEALCHPHCNERYLQINAWYASHPEFCIGSIRNESNGYEEVPTAVFEGDLVTALPERIALLPTGVYRAAVANKSADRIKVPSNVGAKPGSYRLHLGRVHRVEGPEMVDVHDQLNGTQRARIVGLCAIRDQPRALLDAQLRDEGDSRIAHLRALLNGSYDRYVARHGCLSTRANALAFRRDPDYPLLLSLEHYDEESDRATKAALFTRRTLVRVVEPSVAGEPTEALAASMQWRGRVEPAYMARLLSAPEQAVLDALAEAGQVFLDPADSHWKTADEYLSGNVKEKLKQAILSGAACRRNIEALEQVQPDDLLPAAIEPRLGAVWIPAVEVETFVQEVLELRDCEVGYSAQAGAWSVRYRDWNARQNVKVTQEFGTSRTNAIELVPCALNVQVPTSLRQPCERPTRRSVDTIGIATPRRWPSPTQTRLPVSPNQAGSQSMMRNDTSRDGPGSCMKDQSQPTQAASKLPQVTLVFWGMKICTTTLARPRRTCCRRP